MSVLSKSKFRFLFSRKNVRYNPWIESRVILRFVCSQNWLDKQVLPTLLIFFWASASSLSRDVQPCASAEPVISMSKKRSFHEKDLRLHLSYYRYQFFISLFRTFLNSILLLGYSRKKCWYFFWIVSGVGYSTLIVELFPLILPRELTNHFSPKFE